MKSVITIARKYAFSFMKVYGQELTYTDYCDMKEIEKGLQENRYAILSSSVWNRTIRSKIVAILCNDAKSRRPYMSILCLLIRHKRLFLAQRVLDYICFLYRKKNKVSEFVVTSSYMLDAQQKDVVSDFLMRKVGHDVMCSYKVSENLIGGIRMQSDTFLWEYSVQKQLRMLKQIV